MMPWDVPKGFEKVRTRDPLNYSLAEWQQAKRVKQHPKAMKAQIQELSAGSDTRQTFESELRRRGFFPLGDKRGFVGVDWRREVLSLSRTCGAKTKDIKDRLGDSDNLQSTGQAKQWVAQRLEPKVKT
jgi:hypothetical protein